MKILWAFGEFSAGIRMLCVRERRRMSLTEGIVDTSYVECACDYTRRVY